MTLSEELGVRLNVYLQERGVASRRKADELIAAGRVGVNGKIVTSMGVRVSKDAKVTLDGKLLSKTLRVATYILHKPDLCLTSRSDPQGRRTIFDLSEVQKLPANVQPVGRLDFRSEGLLILTNDGNLAFALTHPRFSVEKKYSVLVGDLVAPDELEKLRRGVVLEDGLARAVSVRAGSKENMGAGKKGQWVEIVVTEGRNRLIRRMMEHLGHRVIRLVRISIGDVQLPVGMKPGAVSPVSEKDLAALNRVRDEFLAGVNQPVKTLSTRKPFARRKGMSDEMYAEERARRSKENAGREAERLAKSQGAVAQRKENNKRSVSANEKRESRNSSGQKRAPAKTSQPGRSAPRPVSDKRDSRPSRPQRTRDK